MSLLISSLQLGRMSPEGARESSSYDGVSYSDRDVVMVKTEEDLRRVQGTFYSAACPLVVIARISKDVGIYPPRAAGRREKARMDVRLDQVTGDQVTYSFLFYRRP
jgi:hypothetical protein